MEEKTKPPKGFIKIPILMIIISSLISAGIWVTFPSVVKAQELEERTMFGLKRYIPPLCIPKDEPDPETGCRACGDNARIEYEQCRQSYYLKKQTQLLEIQTEKDQTVPKLELQNQQLQELLEKQNNQVRELIQDLGEESKRVNTLTASLQNAKSLNIGLLGILGIFLIYFIYITLHKKRKNEV